MDDGDDKLIRKVPADLGPPEYVNKEAGETGGDPTLPHNELVRFRTRSGHQILMHNTEDFIYIANARGTAWVELSSDGKIDVYANDSISIHSDNDLNFTADRDVNIEGGRNVNIRASSRYAAGADADGTSGNVQIESKYNMNLRADQDMKLHVERKRDDYVKSDFKLRVEEGNLHNEITAGFSKTLVKQEISVQTEDSYYVEATGGDFNILGQDGVNVESYGGNINLKAGGDHIAGDATKIYWNSAKAEIAINPNLIIIIVIAVFISVIIEY